jgi:hypothetical protein
MKKNPTDKTGSKDQRLKDVEAKLLRLLEKFNGNRFQLAKALGEKYAFVIRAIEKLEKEGRFKPDNPEKLLKRWENLESIESLLKGMPYSVQKKLDTSDAIAAAACLIPPGSDLLKSLFLKYSNKDQEGDLYKYSKMPFNVRWVDGGFLMDRWSLDAFEIVLLIFESGFPAFDSHSLSPVDTEQNLNQLPNDWLIEIMTKNREEQKESLSRLRFSLFDVLRFEEIYGELLEITKNEINGVLPQKSNYDHTNQKQRDLNSSNPLDKKDTAKQIRHSTKCKMKCRKIAQKIWSGDPSITIREMTEKEEILEYSKNQKDELYSEKTIRDWIKDLCPNRNPGRPKKSEK